MTKCPDYNYISLPELLADFTVVKLKDIAMTFGLQFKSGLRKAQLLEILSTIMLNQPQLIIESAFSYELKAWLDIMTGKMTMEEAEKTGYLFELNRFGFVYSFKRKEANVFFQPDLAKKLLPLIPSELERREKDGSVVLEQLALGCANIYGFTDTYYICKYLPQLETRLGRALDEEFLDTALYPILGLTRDNLKGKEAEMMSPFASWIGFVSENGYVNFDIEPKVYDIDTILDFGRMPYPVFPKKCVGQLRKVLSRYGKYKREVDEDIIRDFWLFKQNQSVNCRVPDIDQYFVLKDIDETQECLDAVIAFLNQVPYWRLRGNSSEDLGSKGMQKVRRNDRMPHITMGPNMQDMGVHSWEQLEEMARRGDSFSSQPYVANAVVGRNDPCPCGSGKKYKHCCGK